MCNHINKEKVDENIELCLDCNIELCLHIDIYDSCCEYCGEYIQEVMMERQWTTRSCTFGNSTTDVTDHSKMLINFGLKEDVVRSVLRKYSYVDNTAKNEISIVAACTFFTLIEFKIPMSLKNIIQMFKEYDPKISPRKTREAIASLCEKFPEYSRLYITIPSMIRPILILLNIDEKDIELFEPHILKIAHFVDEKWSSCKTSKRSKPQNIAKVIVFSYIVNSEYLSNIITQEFMMEKFGFAPQTLKDIKKTVDKLVIWK